MSDEAQAVGSTESVAEPRESAKPALTSDPAAPTAAEALTEVTAPAEPTPPPVKPPAAAGVAAPSDAAAPADAGPADATPSPTDTPPAAKAKTAAGGDKPAKKAAGPKPIRQANLSPLYRALRSGRPLEGRIERVIKGGYEIKLHKVRAFCPHSQMDLRHVPQPEEHVGQTHLFRITQLRRGGNDVIVSRRALLEEERLEEAKAVRATLVEGAIMQGHIAGVAGFGAFVDLGAGVSGLVHLSELSHGRVNRVEDAVKVGETVCVKILKVDDERKRISLSIRQAQEDPWSRVGERFPAGKVCRGAVQRLTDFGAFVQIAPGVEALAPAAEFPPAAGGWKAGLEPGQDRDWLVLSVDEAQRRISLTSVPEGFDPSAAPPLEVGAELQGQVQRVERFGVLVWLGPGRVGLMPNMWTGTERGSDLRRAFAAADRVDVVIVELSDRDRRIRLAKKGVRIEPESPPPKRPARPRRKPERTAARKQEPVAASSSGGVFGDVLAEKLRAALGQAEKPS